MFGLIGSLIGFFWNVIAGIVSLFFHAIFSIFGTILAIVFFFIPFIDLGDHSADADHKEHSTIEQGTKLTRSEFKDDWPLTVDTGYVGCTGKDSAIFRYDNKTYALNGIASQNGYQEIDPIWAENPTPFVPKKDLSPLIKKALEECN